MAEDNKKATRHARGSTGHLSAEERARRRAERARLRKLSEEGDLQRPASAPKRPVPKAAEPPKK